MSASIFGVVYLIALQFSSRIFTFVLNVAIVRTLSPEAFGLAETQIQLILATVLLFTRESYRRAFARITVESDVKDIKLNTEILGEKEQKIPENASATLRSRTLTREAQTDPNSLQYPYKDRAAIALTVIPLGVVVTILVCVSFLFFSTKEERSFDQYPHLVVLSGVAAALELFSEPFFLYLQTKSLLKERVQIEGASMLIRCISTFLLVRFANVTFLAFPIGYCIQSIFMFICYIARLRKDIHIIVPIFNLELSSLRSMKSWSIWKLIKGYWLQSIEKWILQEGQRMILKSTCTLYDQASFSVVCNLGSLVARFFFQPMEEHFGINMFSRLIGDVWKTEKVSERSANSSRSQEISGVTAEEEKVIFSSLLLSIVLKIMIYVGFLFVFFGPHYSKTLLYLLYGTKYCSSAAVNLLSYYCIYVFCMGCNGIAEAFSAAVASPAQLQLHSGFLLVVSIVYTGACVTYSLSMKGDSTAAGLIIFDCISMIARSLYALFFAQRFFSRYQAEMKQRRVLYPELSHVHTEKLTHISRSVPPLIVIIVFLVVSCGLYFYSLLYYTDAVPSFHHSLLYIAVGTAGLGCVIIAIRLFDNSFITDIRLLKSKSKTQ